MKTDCQVNDHRQLCLQLFELIHKGKCPLCGQAKVGKTQFCKSCLSLCDMKSKKPAEEITIRIKIK